MSKLYTFHYRITHPAEWVQTEEGDRVEGREGGREGGGSKEGRDLEVQCVYVYLKRACSLSGGRGGVACMIHLSEN